MIVHGIVVLWASYVVDALLLAENMVMVVVGYKIPPQPKFGLGVTLSGLYQRPTLGDIFSNLSDG